MKLIDETLRSAWRRFVRLWRPMAAWTVVVWLALAVALAPLSSAILGWGGLRGHRSVVGNEELLGWVFTVPGLVWVLLAGSLTLMAWVVRFAGLFHIITDDLEGVRPGVRQTLADLAPHVPALARLCMATVLAGMVILAPFLGGLAAIRGAFLAAHDINYYLAERPEAWRRAVLVSGLWAAAWVPPVTYLAFRSLMTLPAYLDGHRPLRSALRRSWLRTAGAGGRLVALLSGALLSWLAARALIQATYGAAGGAVMSWLGEVSASLRPLVLGTAMYVGGAVALDAVLAFVGFSFAATVLVKFYYEDTDLPTLAPSLPSIRQLPGDAIRSVRTRRIRPIRAAGLGLLLVVGSAVLSRILLDRLPDHRPALVVAHRAGPPPAPENTLAALERSITLGADLSEIDVQRTADGVLVVVHDVDLMRVARDPRRIAATEFAEMREVVQRPDDGSPAEERRVATLGEFLERARGRIGLNIELKYYGPDPGLAPAVVREVRARGMEREVELMSLDRSAVEQVRTLAPEIRLGYVMAAAVGDPTRMPVDFLAVSRSRLTPALMRSARERNLQVYAWTVNRPGDMADLGERGVAGLITDAPGLTVRVNEQLAELSPASRILLRFRGRLVDE